MPLIASAVLCLLVVHASTAGTEMIEFRTQTMTVSLSASQGSIVSVTNLKTGEATSFATDEIWMELADCIVGGYLHEMDLVNRSDTSCTFRGLVDGIECVRTYEFRPDRSYFCRSYSITNRRSSPIVVREVTDGSFKFGEPFLEVRAHDDNMDTMDPGTEELTETGTPSLYRTSVNLFLRTSKGGLFTGLKYPYFRPILSQDRIALPYTVNVRLQPGQSMELPKLFCGVYAKTPYSIRKQLHWTPRIITQTQEVLDIAEVQAMQAVMRDHLPESPLPWPGYAIWLNSWWASPALRGTLTPAATTEYRKLLEEVRRGSVVDSVLIAPVWLGWAGFIAPCPEIDAVGEDAQFPLNDNIRALLRHSAETGVPVWGFCEPNAIARHYRADRPDWKLQPTADASQRLIQNCHANPQYEDWFYRLTCSLLDQTAVPGWAWDHGWVRRPMACYDASHGHEPGNCEFQQYRNVTGLIQGLREHYTEHFFEIYWGLKEAGPWSLRGLNSLENAYENNSPAPPGMGAADDLRFQHWYNHNYRFIPTYMNLAQINDRKEKNGFLYSILSCLSASTHASLADWPESGTWDAGSLELLRHWKTWATRNLQYLGDRIDLFGQPCRAGGIDGTAHILQNRGYVFAFNPTDEMCYGSIPMNDLIGLSSGERFTVEDITKGAPERIGVSQWNSDFRFSISPRSARLFEITPTSEAIQAVDMPVGVRVQPAFIRG